MGYVPFSDLKSVVVKELRIAVYNLETVKQLGEIAKREGRPAYLHLKIETGTHRQGVSEAAIPEFLKLIKGYPNLVLEGAYTHFANIEDTTDHSYANYQLDRFRRAISLIEASGMKVPIKHTACSAAALLFPEAYFDLVRLGIGLYGFWPSKETYIAYRLKNKPDEEDLLRPVLSWKTRVAQIKAVPKNSFIGYGCTYRTTHDSMIAVLPVGYYDGYDRGLSNLGYVLVHGQRAPIRGRVCMNLTMVDVTHIPEVKLEDEVTLIGADQGETVTADQLATWLGTIHYEVVTRINPSLPRIIVE
jgi:alanine racemase